MGGNSIENPRVGGSIPSLGTLLSASLGAPVGSVAAPIPWISAAHPVRTGSMSMRRIKMGLLALGLIGCSETTTPAAAVWTGPWMPTPTGERRTTIYYGPWQCTAPWLEECSSKCAALVLGSLGCIWIADIKFDWRGEIGPVPVAAGSRLAITHCCCNYATSSSKEGRKAWERGREKFRREWGEDFGQWPTDDAGKHWPGHHIEDLLHGGDPTGHDNVLPVPPEVHQSLNSEYPSCYLPGSRWAQPGPSKPYAD
jgi:hypothetical protein